MWNNTSEFIGLYASWGITALFLPFARLLPDSTDQTNEITVITPASRPHLSKPANRWRRSSRRGRATQVTQEKNRKERKKNSGACYGVRVKQTRISTLLYQLNQYLWIERTQVLQQVESLTANSSVAPLKIISPLFFSLRLPQLSFQPFCSLFLSLGKRWTLVLFLF